MEDLNMTTPSRELVEQWQDESPEAQIADHIQYLANRAAQWGADQELEACCEWTTANFGELPGQNLHLYRRPKPLSLKQQSLALIDLIQGNEKGWDIRDLDVVRRALEALPDDRT